MIKSVLGFALSRRAIVLLGLLVFIVAGLIAYSKLNIEAYPNPAPVILEITAQAAGLSAEEMEKYYTTPMEIGLYSTPGIDNIRSTSFYGLSFVRVTFKYGVDYYFAYTQAALSLQQNVQLPGNQVAQIQQSSLVGEIYRYQVVGPPHFGLTNLRTVQDWIATRRLSTIPGVSAINSWGGTTKEFDVEADLAKLQAYGITIAQLLTALGNSNVNVGGREISVGQQSVNIRGVGLINDGGNDDLTQGYHVDDIQNVVLGQFGGVPVLVKDVARVSVGFVPRLGIAGRDHEDDVVASIVVMGRTQHTNDVVPRVEKAVEAINSDGSLPPGVKLVPYYDRTSLVKVTTHTVLHNLIFGCLLVFLVQWIFLGDLRSAIIVGVNIPFRGDPGREYFSQPPGDAEPAGADGAESEPGSLRRRSVAADGQGVDGAAAHDLSLGAPGRQGDPVLDDDHDRRLRTALHHAGRRGSDLRADGTDLRLCTGRRPDRDLHRDPGAVIVSHARPGQGDRDSHRPRPA